MKKQSKEEKVRHRIFLRNLPFSVTDSELKTMCSAYGSVLQADIPLDKTTEKSRGLGFVQFASKEELQKAVEALNGFVLQGRVLVAEACLDKRAEPGTMKRSKEKYESKKNAGEPKQENLDRTVLIQNVPFTVGEAVLKRHFETLGPVVQTRLVHSGSGLPHRGIGSVVFLYPEDAEKLLAIAGSEDNEAEPILQIGGKTLIFHAPGETLEPPGLNHLPPLSRAIALDRKNAKKLCLLLRGCPVLDDEPAAQSPSETEVRAKCYREILDKVSRPNFHASETRIRFENIDEKVDERALEKTVGSILEGSIPENKLKKLKKLNEVTVDRDLQGRSKRSAIVEFKSKDAANAFMASIESDETKISDLKRGSQRPIVHFELYDFELSEKIRKETYHSQKKERKAQAKILKGERKILKAQSKRNNSAAKELVRIALTSRLQKDIDSAKQAIEKVEIKGLKQRLESGLKNGLLAPPPKPKDSTKILQKKIKRSNKPKQPRKIPKQRLQKANKQK